MFRTTVFSITLAAAAGAAALAGVASYDSQECSGVPVGTSTEAVGLEPVNLADQWGDIPDVVVIAETETAYTLDMTDTAGGDIPAVVVTASRVDTSRAVSAR